jgi:archaemetzincin
MRVAAACCAVWLAACSDPQEPPAAPVVARPSAAGPDVRLQRAFEPAGHFAPVPKPQPGEWLYEHEEEGQTFEQYIASRPNIPARHEKIYVLPIGDLSAGPSLRHLEDHTERYFMMPVEVLPAVSIEDTKARTRMNDGMRQLLAPEVTDWLRTRLPTDAYCLIGLTMVDLYPEESWNFVFGQASLSGRVGVFSFARNDYAYLGEPPADPKLVFQRAMKVMTHEIGHMFGIQHCVHFSCDMNGSNSLAESDTQPAEVCPVCLRKLHHAVGFDPEDRFEKLREFYDAHTLTREAAFVRKRLDHITAPPGSR